MGVAEAEFGVNLFVALFALIDPIGTAPLFAAATLGVQPRARMRLAFYVSGFALVFLCFFLFTGLGLLKFFGISLPAFRIAGGIMLLLLGLDMARNDYTPAMADAVAEGEVIDNAAYARREFEKLIVPFGMPLLIGPGAISTVVIFASRGQAMGWTGMVAGVLSIAAVCVTILLAFLAAAPISRLLGKVGMMIIVRVLGLILAALAIQFILIGVSDATAGFVKRSAANPYPSKPAISAPVTPPAPAK